jgi:hypothetical protein
LSEALRDPSERHIGLLISVIDATDDVIAARRMNA